MSRDPCLKLCLCLKFSEPEVCFVVNLLSAYPCSQRASTGMQPRTFIPRLSLCGTAGEASTSRCLGRVLPSKGSVSSRTLPLPALSRHGSDGKAGEMEGLRRGGETGHLILSVLCLILSTLLVSLLIICMFSLPNLPYEK